MRASHITLIVLLGALGLSNRGPAGADDAKPSSSPVPSTAEPAVLPARVVEFKGVARFHVVSHDRAAGTVTIRLADPAVRMSGAPVVTMGSADGPQTLTFVPVEGQPGTWRLTSPFLRQSGIDGSTMKIIVGDKTYSAPFLAAAPVTLAARHGGRVFSFADCGASIEVVRDPATGTLTLYALDGARLSQVPVIVLEDDKDASAVKVVEVEGQAGVWTAVHPAFKDDLVRARLRLLLGDRPCEADITDGRVVTVDGLRLQVAVAKGTDTYLVRALDATLEGKAYTIENPRVAFLTKDGERTVPLVPVEGQARTWRLVMQAGVPEGTLRFTLAAKPREAHLVFFDAR